MTGPDPHEEVLARCMAIYRERNAEYKDVWRTYGWRGAIVEARKCGERAMRKLWGAEPNPASKLKVDDLLDMINYAVFAIRSIEEGNRDGIIFRDVP